MLIILKAEGTCPQLGDFATGTQDGRLLAHLLTLPKKTRCHYRKASAASDVNQLTKRPEKPSHEKTGKKLAKKKPGQAGLWMVLAETQSSKGENKEDAKTLLNSFEQPCV